MTKLIEPEIIQNDGIAAVVLWAFINEYCAYKPVGPSILWLMPLLPMVFHKDTVDSICTRHFDGGILLAFSQDRTLSLGLQERMEAMATQTLVALNVALASGLVAFDNKHHVISMRRTPPFTYGANIKPLISTAERIGYWLGNSTEDMAVSILKIRF